MSLNSHSSTRDALVAAATGLLVFGFCVVATLHKHSDGPRLVALIVLMALICLARQLSSVARIAIAGLILGSGQIDTSFAGGAIVPIGLIVGLLIALPRADSRSIALKVAWVVAAALLLASVAVTARSGAHVDLTILLSLVAILLAARWTFADEPSDIDFSSGLVLLQIAGVVCGVLVIISYARGSALVTQTASEVHNSLVSADLTQRGSGPWSSPNEAGMILSAGLLATMMNMGQSIRTRGSLLSLAVVGVALVLTGSRASILAAVLGGGILWLSLFRRKATTNLLIAASVAAAYWVVLQAGTLAGRSLNPFTAHDKSSYFRHEIQSYLFAHIDWTKASGYGFVRGAQIAPNPISGTFPNVDEAWLFTALCLGGLCVLAFIVLFASELIHTASVSWLFALAALAWLITSSVAENLFLDAGPCVAGVLLLGSAQHKRSSATASPLSAPASEGAFAGEGVVHGRHWNASERFARPTL